MKIAVMDIFTETIPQAEESGSGAEENARLKASHYSGILKKNILAEDDAFYFNGLKTEGQPAYLTHRISGKNNAFRFWKNLLIKMHIKTGRLEKSLCLINILGAEAVCTVDIPFSVIIPENEAVTDNSLNNFIVPDGFFVTIDQMTEQELENFHRTYILPKLTPLLEQIK